MFNSNKKVEFFSQLNIKACDTAKSLVGRVLSEDDLSSVSGGGNYTQSGGTHTQSCNGSDEPMIGG